MSKKDRVHSLGDLGEELAASFFKERGYDILERNYRVPVGEIDLICKKGDLIVFVEVKARSTRDFGGTREAITQKKIGRIRKAARWYIMEKTDREYDYRFDCLLVERCGDCLEVEHIAAAFEA